MSSSKRMNPSSSSSSAVKAKALPFECAPDVMHPSRARLMTTAGQPRTASASGESGGGCVVLWMSKD
jgi:hypothetical protein